MYSRKHIAIGPNPNKDILKMFMDWFDENKDSAKYLPDVKQAY